MGWKSLIRDYLTFNKRETRGLILLIIIFIALAGVNYYVRQQSPEPIELSDEEKLQFEEMKAKIGKREKSDVPISDTIQRIDDTEFDFFPFDPNTVTIERLIEMGMDKQVAERLSNYRNKGGRFNKGEDILKIYGIDSNWVLGAIDFIEITEIVDDEPLVDSPDESKAKEIVQIVELNAADSSTLDALPGIGPFYCRNILKYRKSLGGFYSVDQLEEVYKMRSSTLEMIRDKVEIDTNKIKAINLNDCEPKELASHPYISWKEAKVICAYREQHGKFDHPSWIKKTDVISDSLYKKIAPYLVAR